MGGFPRRRPLTTAQQYFGLQTSRLCPGAGRLHRNRLRWEFTAQPTPLGRRYRLRLDYELGDKPNVYVMDPDLVVLADGRRLPHVYQQQPPRLCLYLPNTGEWSAQMRLVDTIVPWSVLWLFYFEDWLETDEWKGGGMHPEPEEKRDAAHLVD
jgi:hypothetical protein